MFFVIDKVNNIDIIFLNIFFGFEVYDICLSEIIVLDRVF